MNNPLISVLMVTYNRASILKETIESVLNQTYKNIQFIIVDDGSTDESCAVIESFQDERIELYKLKENRHICYATNYGFSKVTGEYLARIDSDDVWYPEKLEKQLNFLKNNKEYKVCFSWIDLIDENSKNINNENQGLLHLFESDFKGQKDCLRFFFMHGNCLSHPSVLMETEVMKKTGDFNPGYMQSHDFEYWIRIAKKYPIYVMKDRLLAMRRFDGGENNSNTSYTNSLRFYNEYIDIKKHFFDDMDNALFVEIFKEDFKNKNASSVEELECEKAFLLLRPVLQSTVVPTVAIDKFFELLSQDKTRRVLEEQYDFTEKSFYEMTGKNIHYDYFLEQEINTLNNQMNQIRAEKQALIDANQELKDTIQGLLNEKQMMNEQIRLYSDSLSWKVTEPLRRTSRTLKSVLKKKA